MTTEKQGTGPDPRPVDADNTTRIDGRGDVADTMPDVFELIATIKNLCGGSTCPKCQHAYAHVDGLLAARFEDVR